MNTHHADREWLVAVLGNRPAATETMRDAEWTRRVALAQRHHVAPALYVRVRERGLIPPPPLVEQLRGDCLSTLAQNTLLFHERDRILHAFTAARIQVVVFKGACLAEVLYGNIGMRPMGDIDLWVSKPHLDEARAVMRSLGFAAQARADRPQALQDALAGETQFLNASGWLVELHWTVFPGEWLRHTARVDEQIIWQRTQAFHSDLIRQLAPEDAVIHLCVHVAVNHQMSELGLRTLLDLELARQVWRIDWLMVSQRARAWRVSCTVWLVLTLLAELWGDPERALPLAGLAPSAWRQCALHRLVSVRQLMTDKPLSRGPRRFLFLLLLVDRPIDALALVGHAVCPDATWLTLRYGLQAAPRWRVWLQRLWHPILVALRREI